MDCTVSLALMEKARRMFEAPNTFLSFPLTPVAFSPESLGFLSTGATTTAGLTGWSDFSRLVNQIPTGVVWMPVEERYLWDIYEDVLKTAQLAVSSRTSAEETQYQNAVKYLHTIDSDGLYQDTAVVTEYKRYRDAHFATEAEYANRRIEADLSTDAAVKQRWQQDEPILRKQVDDTDQQWLNQGYRSQVENAQRIESTLGAKAPVLTWEAWDAQFNMDLDTLTDLNNVRFAATGLSPSNILDSAVWQRFTVSGAEANALVAQAPPELRARLAPKPVDLDIESLSFDYLSVVVNRPWFISDVFKARFWKLPGGSPELSDGQTPPSGRCPSYVAALVLARNLEVRLKPQSPKNAPALAQLAGTKALSLGPFQIASRPAAPTMLVASPTVAVKTASVKTATASGAAAAVKMSPMIFKASPILAQPRMTALQPKAPVVARLPRVEPFTRMQSASFEQVRVQAPLFKVAVAMPAATPAASPDITVVAFICKRLPRSPDPDPSLQW